MPESKPQLRLLEIDGTTIVTDPCLRASHNTGRRWVRREGLGVERFEFLVLILRHFGNAQCRQAQDMVLSCGGRDCVAAICSNRFLGWFDFAPLDRARDRHHRSLGMTPAVELHDERTHSVKLSGVST